MVYVYIETSLKLMSTYIRLFKGLTMKSSLYEVLCPHRDKSDVYVHIHQDFHRFDNGVIIVYEVYVHIETSLMFMSTYIRIFNGLTMALSFYRSFMST